MGVWAMALWFKVAVEVMACDVVFSLMNETRVRVVVSALCEGASFASQGRRSHDNGLEMWPR